MKTRTRKLNSLRIGMLGILLSALLLVVVPSSGVFAQTEEEPVSEEAEEPRQGNVGQFFEGVLVRMYAYQKSMAEYLDRTASSSDRVAAQAQDRIAELQEDGMDTTVLEEALDSFYRHTSEAEQSLDAANSLLDRHAGFDEDGRVTDLEEARDTVFELEEHISLARSNIIDAIRAVMEGLQQYRETNVVEE